MTARQLFTVVLGAALLGLAATRATDPDMWWHLRTGETIVQHGIPRQDSFSFTVPGRAWVTHEWLSEVLMWTLYRVGGFAGLILFFSLLIAAALGLVYRISFGRPYVAAFVTILAALTAAPLWGTRPQMFNFFFFAVYIAFLESFRNRAASGARTSWIGILVPLTALWANLHSGYLLGVVLVALYGVGELLQGRLTPGDNRALPRRAAWALVGVAVAALLAALLNPNGWRLWLYPFETLGSPVMQDRIVEWFSPDFHNLYNLPFLGLLLIGVGSFIYSPKKPCVTDLLLFGGTAAAGLISIRHMPLFALAATPTVSRYAAAVVARMPWGARWLDSTNAPTPRRLQIFNGIAALLVLFFPLARWTESIAGHDGRVAAQYPAAAVAYLKDNGLAERRIFNAYGWGGFLIWHRIPVFVDGRADVYGDEFLRGYLRTADIRGGWREALADYDVDVVFIEAHGPLATLLAENGEWRETYRDDLAVIFVRP